MSTVAMETMAVAMVTYSTHDPCHPNITYQLIDHHTSELRNLQCKLWSELISYLHVQAVHVLLSTKNFYLYNSLEISVETGQFLAVFDLLKKN